MKRLAAIGTLIVLCATSPRNAMAVDQKAINDRTTELKMMSPVERDRLDRNIQEFQALSSSQKAAFRSMHAELLDDRANHGGLTALLQTYSAWLHSLSPAQRDEVKNEPDPVKKLAIVRRIKDEIDHPKAVQESHPDTVPAQPSMKFPPKMVLDSKDVAAVVKAIADRLPTSRMTHEFEQPQLESYLPIIQASIQESHNPKEWPDDQLMQLMIASIRTKDQQNVIVKSSSKREAMIRRLLTGIWNQVNDTIRFPTEEERLQTYDSLTPAERQNVMAHPPAEVRRMLTLRYFASKGDDSIKKLPEYRRRLTDLFERLEVPPPPRLVPQKPRQPHDKS